MLKREFVWDYPRPPRLEPVAEELLIQFDDHELARTTRGFRVLETSHPPVYYFPPHDLDLATLRPIAEQTYCEWKGRARYFDLVFPQRVLLREAWAFDNPTPAFEDIRGYVAFYARHMECFVDGERVEPQPGEFYGGWVTSNLEGPFKGGPGTRGW